MSAAAVTAGGARGGNRFRRSEKRGGEAIHLRYCVMDCFASLRKRFAFVAGNDEHHDSAGRAAAAGRRFGSHRVNITLTHESTPSKTIEAAASLKKS
jgi:hypothetical protein